MDELLPCPFCGSPAALSFSRDGETCNVRCSKWAVGTCLGAGPNCYDRKEAAVGWNRRAAVAAQPEAARPVDATAIEWKDAVWRAYMVLRRNDNTIPSEWLEFMKSKLLASAPTIQPTQPVQEREDGKWPITVEDLHKLATIAMTNGKTEAFFQVTLQWADKANAEIARLNAALSATPPAQPEPDTVRVPKRLTQAMRDVMDSEGWAWEDLLAAAESITEDEYTQLAGDAGEPSDGERLDWLENNLFHVEPDEWTAKYSPHLNTWRIFAPKGVQGSARTIIDAAIRATKGGKL